MSQSYSTKYPHRYIMYQIKLNDNNFSEWYRNLRNVLEKEGRLYVLDSAVPMTPPRNGSKELWLKTHRDHQKVQYLIRSSFSDEYAADFMREIEYLPTIDLINEIKERFQLNRAGGMGFSKEINKPMKFKYSVEDHVNIIIEYVDRLEKLGYPMNIDMVIDTILISLPQEYEDFVKGYKKDVFGGSVAELKDMLVATEGKLKEKDKSISTVESSSRGAKRSRDVHPYDQQCIHCGKTGHGNCSRKYSRLVGSSSSGELILKVSTLRLYLEIFSV